MKNPDPEITGCGVVLLLALLVYTIIVTITFTLYTIFFS